MRTFLSWMVATLLSTTLYAQVDVLTQHNDIGRTGWNSQETSLTQANIRPILFGKLFTYAVDDQVYSQPLIVTAVNMPGVGVRNLAIVATTNNTIYAFDADGLVTTPYWSKNFTPGGSRPPANSDYAAATLCQGNYQDFTSHIGIVGTPVIDKAAGYIYFVSRDVPTSGTQTFTQRLHAVSITTGLDRQTPTVIAATVSGTGTGSSGGSLSFNSFSQNQRPGLLLLNGVIYIGYSSHCDMDPYHGWLLGYNAADLSQKYVYCTTSGGDGGGIWQSGNGIAADNAGDIFIATGNGTTDATANPVNLSASMIKLTPSGSALNVTDYFTPANFATLDQGDLDFGPCETLIIPGLNRILTGAKDGNLYLLDQNNLGQFTGSNNNFVQNIFLSKDAHLRTSFGYYKGTANEFVYTWPENSNLKAWPVNRASGNFTVASVVTSGLVGPQGNNGANMCTSSNGSTDNTAVLWVTHANNGCDANHSTCPGIVRAVSATDVTKELWNSTQVPTDDIGNYAKMSSPTVANGKLYVASFSNSVSVYGLLGNGVDTCTSANIALNQPATASSTEHPNEPANAFDGNTTTTRWASLGGMDNSWIYVDLGKSYDLCKVIIYWESAFGKDFDIQVSNDASTWKTIYSVRGNTQTTNIMPLQGSGRYVKMQGITRGTTNGYSIYEMQVYGTPTVTCFPPGGLGASNIQQNTATLNWNAVSGATGYSVQYKAATDAVWTTTSTTGTSLSLSALSCGTDYLFQVATNCTGSQTSTFASAGFSTLPCSAGCGPVPTRWTTADIGSVGVAGQTCFDGTTFSMQASGTDIGGTVDAFQFAFVTLSGTEELVGRVASQDNDDVGAKEGIMIRQTNDPGSPNAFVALTGSGNAIFQTRGTMNGPTAATTVTGLVAPYWLKLAKSGSVYTGYTSPNGLTWSQIGSPQDLGFGSGNNSVTGGLALTSGNNTTLTAASFDNFTQATPLPIELSSFTGKATGQEIVLQWTTEMEQNAGYFEVQRSADGIHFSVIGNVTAVGNSSSPQDYHLTDAQPLKGVNYYRLREVDLDGQSSYSPVILVRWGNVTAPLIFPNPASSYFQVVPGSDVIREVNVYDISGRRMFSQLNGNSAGVLNIPVGRLSQGMYFVEIRTDKGRTVQKLIKR